MDKLGNIHMVEDYSSMQQTTGMCNDMDDSQMPCCKWVPSERSLFPKHIFRFHLYDSLQKAKATWMENPPVVGRDEGWRKGWPQRGSIREFFGVMKLWGILILVVDTQFYVFVKSYRIMHQKKWVLSMCKYFFKAKKTLFQWHFPPKKNLVKSSSSPVK